jgi:hypothetical protein
MTNVGDTQVGNQSNDDAIRDVLLACVQYMMSLPKDYGCVVTISRGEKARKKWPSTAVSLGKL